MLALDDLLDSEEFDAIRFINGRFPNEESLDDLDRFVVGISAKIGAVDDEISRAVQSQSRAGEQASRDIRDAQVSISELFDKLNDIKGKASQSERMVQEICADIKKLDYAKTHLQSTITSLKRLQMLITAVGQLEMMASGYHYREVANLMEAVKQLMSHFERYTSIPKVAEIKARVVNIQADLKRHVHAVFREIGQMVETVADADTLVENLPGNMKSMADACLVIDSLGASARKDLLDEFVEQQLQPYDHIFGPSQAHFGLDQVDRRWAWIKRLVRNVDSKFGSICPAHWRLPHRLCVSFIDRTKVHFIQLLTAEQNSDVTLLLKTLQATLRFEQDMKARFDEDATEIARKQAERDSAPSSSPSDAPVVYTAAGHGSARKNITPAQPIFTSLDPDESVFREEDALVLRLVEPNTLSSVFDQFLGGYVVMERKSLDDMLQKLIQEDDVSKTTSDGGSSQAGANVYNSSVNMFVFIKNSIKRCTALTNGSTFLALSKEFRTCLRHYAEALKDKCPAPHNAGPPVQYRLPPGSEQGICYIINTCEYCADVIPQLESLIQSKMASALVDQVDLNAEADLVMDVVAHCIKILVSGVMDKLEASFRAMQGVNWASVSSVGEESPHVHQMNNVLQEFTPRVRENLSPIYFRNLCTKLATDMLQRYQDTILRQKRISDLGAQQLLLDTYNVKSMLMHLHHSGADAGSVQQTAVPAMYMKLVTSRVSLIETILKLIGLPDDILVDRFRVMWPDGNANDLQAVLSLRGLKKPDQQQPYFDQFNSLNPPPVGRHDGADGLAAAGDQGARRSSLMGMSSSVRSLTQDLSLSARSAVGDFRKVVQKINN